MLPCITHAWLNPRCRMPMFTNLLRGARLLSPALWTPSNIGAVYIYNFSSLGFCSNKLFIFLIGMQFQGIRKTYKMKTFDGNVGKFIKRHDRLILIFCYVKWLFVLEMLSSVNKVGKNNHIINDFPLS